MADAPPGYQSSSMIPAAGGIIHAMRGGGIPPPGYNPDSLISLTPKIPIVGFEGGGGERTAAVTDSAEPFDDDLAKKIAVAAVVSSPATNTNASTSIVTPVIDAATTAVTAATTATVVIATKEINLNGRRLTIGAPDTWDATMNVPSTPEYEALKWFGVHKTKRNDLKKEILQALYDGICDTNKPLIMALECEPLRRIIQSLAEIQMGNLMAPVRMMSARTASTDMNEAILMTFNVFQHSCQAKKAADYIIQSNADIVCTQEDTDGSKLNNYTEVKSCGGGSETERVYMKNNIATNIECILVPGISIGTIKTQERSAVLFTVQGVKIANVHLEGGRFADDNLFTNTAALQAKKLELLNTILSKNPNIIVGDFNSVYHSDPIVKQRSLDSQYDYFSRTVLKKVISDADKKIIDEWNNTPYELLVKSGYKYATPSNEDQNTNGNTIVDAIWYKEDKDLFELKDTRIDTRMKTGDKYDNPAGCEYSDHNPVLTTIVFKNTAAAADAAAVVAADAATIGADKKMAAALDLSTSASPADAAEALTTGVKLRPPYPSSVSPGIPLSIRTVSPTNPASVSPIDSSAAVAALPSPPGNADTVAALPSPPGSASAGLLSPEQQRKKEQEQKTRNEARFKALLRAGQLIPEEQKSEEQLSIERQDAADSMFIRLADTEENKNELAKKIAVAAVATIMSNEVNNNENNAPPPPTENYPNSSLAPAISPSVSAPADAPAAVSTLADAPAVVDATLADAPADALAVVDASPADAPAVVDASPAVPTASKSISDRQRNIVKGALNTQNARNNFNKYSTKLKALTTNLKAHPKFTSPNDDFKKGLEEINEALADPSLTVPNRPKVLVPSRTGTPPPPTVKSFMGAQGIPYVPPVPSPPTSLSKIKPLNQQLRNSGVNLTATTTEPVSKPVSPSLNELNRNLFSRAKTSKQSPVPSNNLKLKIGTALNMIDSFLSQADNKLRNINYEKDAIKADHIRKIKSKLTELRVKLQKESNLLDSTVATNVLSVNDDDINNNFRVIATYQRELESLLGGKRRSKKHRTQKKKNHNKRSTQRK